MKAIWKRTPWLVLCLLFIQCTKSPAAAQKEAAALEATAAWLAHVDAGDYAASWEEASKLLQSSVARADWSAALSSVAAQVEAVSGEEPDFSGRSVVATRYTQDLPQAPKGEYVIAQYRSAQGEQGYIETITLRLENEGWKVTGYFVKPE